MSRSYEDSKGYIFEVVNFMYMCEIAAKHPKERFVSYASMMKFLRSGSAESAESSTKVLFFELYVIYIMFHETEASKTPVRKKKKPIVKVIFS